MKQCYDRKSNKLLFTDANGITFDFQMRGMKTIVHGDSATGKSLLCTRLREIQNDYNQNDVLKKYNADNIVVADKNWLNVIENLNSKLIIIDRADIVLTEEIKECIKNDCSNVYLLFMRGHIGLNISPNYYAHLVRDDNTILLEYEFSAGGWF